jgi:hypothetical protein
MSCNIPVLAWDEGALVDPLYQKFARNDVPVSSVPYFDERCGERFKLLNFEDTFERFWANRPRYAPRSYVKEVLSLQSSARAYLKAYRELM